MTNITAIINTHGNPDTTYDTIDSVKHYMTDKILLLVEESAWNLFDTEKSEVAILKGFTHRYYKSPYRNVVLGLLAASQHWQTDWYCYMEYDCLVCSEDFKVDISVADKNNVWCLGNDFRVNQKEKMPIVEVLLKKKFDEVFYILGACVFLNCRFIKKAMELNFFERFLYYTNDFRNDFFPGYDGWDVIEHLLPTLAKHWGGGVQQFAKWSKSLGMWTEGDYQKYPMRWFPDIAEEDCSQASIVHPVKDFTHPARIRERRRRRA